MSEHEAIRLFDEGFVLEVEDSEGRVHAYEKPIDFGMNGTAKQIMVKYWKNGRRERDIYEFQRLELVKQDEAQECDG